MSEIKSTLDLVMEKAKGFTLTEDEKKEFQRREVEGKMKGIFQKYLDGVFNIERAGEEIGGLSRGTSDVVKAVFGKACASRIGLKGDNGPVIDLIKEVTGTDVSALEEVISNAFRSLGELEAGQKNKILERLKQKGISGSALIPNLNADPEWIQRVEKMEVELRSKVEELI
ncbi:hypothetical protein ACFL2O_02665 [Thermodesulfobacteriota bacterium]